MSYKTRVLLAEDEKDARDILTFYLNNLFDVVDVVKNGEEGYKLYKKTISGGDTYDLVITDIKMPKVDGLSMVEEMTKLNKNQKYIIVSAYKDEEYLFRAIGLNIAGYFVKPLDIDKMMELLKKIKEDMLKNRSSNNFIKLNDTYRYDIDSRSLYRNDENIKFSKKESLLIETLIKNIDKIVDNEVLKKSVWQDKEVSDSTLRTTMKRVKDKIKDNDFIISRKGLGYLIEKK
jgi:DNA-binding response OmpR family regulator